MIIRVRCKVEVGRGDSHPLYPITGDTQIKSPPGVATWSFKRRTFAPAERPPLEITGAEMTPSPKILLSIWGVAFKDRRRPPAGPLIAIKTPLTITTKVAVFMPQEREGPALQNRDSTPTMAPALTAHGNSSTLAQFKGAGVSLDNCSVSLLALCAVIKARARSEYPAVRAVAAYRTTKRIAPCPPKAPSSISRSFEKNPLEKGRPIKDTLHTMNTLSAMGQAVLETITRRRS